LANKDIVSSSDISAWRVTALRRYIALVDSVSYESILEADVLPLLDLPVPSGIPFPLLFNSRTNAVESEMGAAARAELLSYGFRFLPPPIAAQSFLRKAAAILHCECHSLKFLVDTSDQPLFTHIGIALLKELRREARHFRVEGTTVIDGEVWYDIVHTRRQGQSYCVRLDGVNSICQ
jgi:hypothetical protein